MGLFAGLTLTLAAWVQLGKAEQARLDVLKQSQASALIERVEQRMTTMKVVLQGAAGYLGGGALPSRAEWHGYVESLNLPATYPGIQGMGYAEWIPKAEVDRHLERVRKAGFPESRILPGDPLPADPEGCSAIVYLEPVDVRNLKAFGKDMYAEPVRREAMTRARDTGRPALSGKVVLYQEGDTAVQGGTLLFVPVYRPGQPLDTLIQRRQACRGWAYHPLRMGDLLGATLSQDGQFADFELYDGPKADPEHLLFDSDPSMVSAGHGGAIQRTFQVAGRTWLVTVEPNQAFFASAGQQRHLHLLVWGVITSLLIFILLIAVLSGEDRARLLAQRRGEALLATESKFRALFERAPMGMAVVESTTGRFLSVNRRLGEILGFTVAELQTGTFQAVTHPEHVDADTAMVQQLVSGSVVEVHKDKRYLHHDGHVVWGRLTMVKLPSESDHPPTHLSMVEDITETHRVEEALRASEQRFKGMFELSPDPISLTRLSDGTLLMANPAWCELTGFSLGEALGRSPVDLGLWPCPEQRETLVRDIRERGRISARDVTLRSRDGSERQLLITAQTMHFGNEDLILLIAKDVTERQRAVAALVASEARFRDVVENAGDAIFLNDEEGHIFLCNRAACTNTGYTMEELLALRIQDLDSEYREARNARSRHGLEPGQQVSILARHRRKDGSTFPVEVRISLLRDEEPRQILAVVHDLSQREQIEESEFRARKAESLVLMAGGIAHDFNNLFQGILGYLEIAGVKAGDNPSLMATLNKAVETLQSAIALSWKMLDFSGRGFLKPESLDLEGWLPVYLATLRGDLPPTIQLEASCEAVPSIQGDITKLEQVVKAIVDNAREALGAQGGRIRVRLRADFGADRAAPESPGIWPLRRPDDPATVCLEISDDGPGVAAEHLTRICDPFYTTKELGRGLSLAATVGILRAHRAGLHILNGAPSGLILRLHFPPNGA